MPNVSIQQAFELAMQHHQAGRLHEAEHLYRQILAHQPRHADALHLLGVIAYQFGRNDVAVDLIRQCLELKPRYPEAHNNLGNALRSKGQLPEAIAAYRQAIALNPRFPDAYNNLGIALNVKGQSDEAITAFRQALSLNSSFPDAHNNLGIALNGSGQLEQAIVAYRQALALKPNFPEAYHNLGLALHRIGQLDEAIAALRQALALDPRLPDVYNHLGQALREQGRLDEAIATFRQAVALKPDLPEAFNGLGIALRDQGHLDQAIAACRQAIALKPHYPEAYGNLGNALRDTGHLDDAIAAYRHAIALNPVLPETHNNLGAAFQSQGQLDEAIAAFRHAIALNPSYPEAHDNLALLLLVRGDFDQGWKEYEWRWLCKSFPSPRWRGVQQQWDGSDLTHRTILLHAEQGFGDTLQFIRYMSHVAARGGKVFVLCPPELRRLLQGTPGVEQWLSAGEPLPPIDVHCPLLSLPLAFGTTLQSIPHIVPYLKADAEGVEWWRKELADRHRHFKVGLVWAGNPRHQNHRNRSVSLAALAPLAQVQGVSFFSLQKGAAGLEAKNPRPELKLIDRTAELRDFADTAALIAQLDLVISVDTAVAHLAGAMGKPVWTLLPFVPDWRWLLEREDSPWYPTMRLFRQPSIGDWDSVIGRVSEALAEVVLSANRQR